jgi:ankyrin repeat protein
MRSSKGAVRSKFGAALLACGVVAIAGAARADEAECRELDRKFETGQREFDSLQVNSLLFAAADNECAPLVERLLGAGASFKARDRMGSTVLSHAARAGALPVIKILIDSGADPNQRNLQGSTALFLAIESNRTRVVETLLDAGAKPDLPGRAGVSPISAAAYQGSLSTVELLLERGADPLQADTTGKTPIVYAAARGFSEIVERLLETGIDVNAHYGNDLTLLMWAAGHADDVPEQDGVDLVRSLIEKGARIDAADNRGRTALMIAAEQGHGAIASALIEAGADRTLRDKDGKTAADLASDDATRVALAAH